MKHTYNIFLLKQMLIETHVEPLTKRFELGKIYIRKFMNRIFPNNPHSY